MTDLTLRFETLTLQAAGGADGEAVRALLERALERLAARIGAHPSFPGLDTSRVIERLELEALPADLLFGPSGAEQLADELYAALVRGLA